MELQERGKCNDARCVCKHLKAPQITEVNTVPECMHYYTGFGRDARVPVEQTLPPITPPRDSIGVGVSSQMEERIVTMMSAMEARLLAAMKAEVAKLKQPPQARNSDNKMSLDQMRLP